MKKIIIKRIALTDWKAKNLDVKFNDGTTRISAKNEVGKSSLQQAWMWVLTSYTTPLSSKNEELYDNRIALSPETPEAKVKVWIEVGGVEYTIERTARAKFKRPRGRVEFVKDSSDDYTIKIDGIEYSATDFDEWVSNTICPINHLPFVLDGAFFSVLAIESKMKARDVLEKLIGEVEVEDIGEELKEVAENVGKIGLDQMKAQTALEVRRIKAQIDALPVVIKEAKSLIGRLNLKTTLEGMNNAVDAVTKSVLEYPTENMVKNLVLLSKELAFHEIAEAQRTLISTKEKERRILAFSLAKAEGEKMKVEEYAEMKAEAVGNKINSLLNGCQVQMFDYQKNGEKTPDCILLDDHGVKYSTLSTSARLRVNIAVQNMFRKYYGVDIMTWVDEAAVFDNDSLPTSEGQVCYLFASDSPTLVVE